MFGSVFLGDPSGRQVAVKVLSEAAIGDMAVNKEMSITKQFKMQENKASWLLNIFKSFSMFSKDGFGFIVMELLTNKGAKMNLVKDIFKDEKVW